MSGRRAKEQRRRAVSGFDAAPPVPSRVLWTDRLTVAGLLTGALIPFVPTSALALPEGGTVAAGTATVTSTATAMQINQATDRLVMDWTRFNIAANESVRFQQPSAAAIALNRVSGQEPSAIFGSLSANGQIFLLNPSGILFGASSRVDVGALTASTHTMTNQDFLAGQYRFTQDAGLPNAAVVNQGVITAGPGGYVALLGAAVRNEGVIQAHLGSIALAAGKAATLDMRGDGLIEFVITDALSGSVNGPDGQPLASYVSNSGTLQADGGLVTLQAKAAAGVVQSVVNQEGIIRATSLVNHGGVIKLIAEGDQSVAWNKGTLDVSAGEANAAAGSVTISAPLAGQSGTILARGAEQADGGHVEITSTQQTGLFANSTIDVSGVGDSSAGSVRAWSDSYTVFSSSATIAARGGDIDGNGGFVEISGKEALNFAGHVDALAPQGTAGTLLLDPTNITIQTGGTDNTLTDLDAFSDSVCVNCVTDSSALNAAAANVVLQATNNITFTNAVSMSNGGVGLTAQAGNAIIVNAGITTQGGRIVLSAGDAGGPAQAGASLTVNAALDTTNAGGNADITLQNTGTGGIALGANLTAGTGTIRLVSSGGVITQTAGTMTATNLGARASGAITLNQNNTVTTLAGTISGAGNAFQYTDADGLAIGSVSAADNFSATDGVSTSNGSITLTLNDIDITQPMSAGTGIVTIQQNTLTTAIELGTNVGGRLSMTDAELDLITASVLRLGSPSATANTNISGAITNPAGWDTLSLRSGNSASSTVTQTASISVPNLAANVGGRVTLTTAGNDINVISSLISLGDARTFNYTDVNGVTVGTVDGLSGVTTGNAAITINTGNTITATQNLNAGSGRVTLNPTAGGVNQTGGVLTATNLQLTGAGTFSLTSATNNVTNIAANVTGPITYTDTNALTVTTVNGTVGITTANNDVTLNAGGLLTISQGLNAGTGTGTLNTTSGGVNQTAGTLTGSNLLLVGAGTYTLNQTNVVTTLAANVTGSISYTDTNDITVGTIAGTTGITTNNNNVTLTVNDITISQALNAGAGIATIQQRTGATQIDLGTNTGGRLSMTDAELDLITASVVRIGNTANAGAINITAAITNPAGYNTLDLRTGGTIVQTASLVVPNLAVQSTGAVTMTTAGNDVDTLAANVTGAGNGFSYTDSNALTIGTVDGVSGITTNNGNITVNSGDALTISQNIAGGTGTVTLNPTAGGVNQTGGALTASNLLLTGAGSFTLTQVANDIGTIAANVSGPLSYTDANAVTVGTVGSVNGITTTSTMNLTGGGAITVMNSVSGAGSVTLTAGGALTGAGGIGTGGDLTLNASSVGTVATPLTISAIGGELNGTLSGAALSDVFNVKSGGPLTITLGLITAIGGLVGHPVTIDSTFGSILHGGGGTDIIGGRVNFWGASIGGLNFDLQVITDNPPVFCNGTPCGLPFFVNTGTATFNLLFGLSDNGRYLLGAKPEETTLLTAGVLPDHIYTCLNLREEAVRCTADAVWQDDDGTNGALSAAPGLAQEPTNTVAKASVPDALAAGSGQSWPSFLSSRHSMGLVSRWVS